MEMTKLDRTVPPKAAAMTKAHFPRVNRQDLSNGMTLYSLQFGSQEIIELNAVFPGGKSFEPALSIASFTAKMMQEGTKNHSSLDFARLIDSYGASISADAGFESATVSLTSLAKHMKKTIPLWAEMINDPVLPQSELEKLQKRTLQQLDVESKKTGFVARREFNRLLFGMKHPYGSFSEKEDIANLLHEQVVGFHKKNYHPANAVIIAVGRFNERLLVKLLEDQLGRVANNKDLLVSLSGSQSQLEAIEPQKGLQYFEKAESMQATVRVGHRGFKRVHPDFYPMQVVNTVLGGYFGSRLMKNIREEKGYTYGIGSAWLAMKYDGIFLIQTDVDNKYIKPTLAEIKKEMQNLIEHGVDQAELDLVRNYMLGKSATSRETPSQLAGMIQNALVNDFSFDEIDRKYDVIMGLTTRDIKVYAEKYLRPELLLEVVCGKM